MNDSNKRSRSEYDLRINRVQDYVKKNLDSDLSLDVLAKVGCFSKFYFSRVFQAIAGESLNSFVNRNRVEASAFRLLNNKSKSITEIAYEYGFTSPSVYSRAFRNRYQISPSEWRLRGSIKKSNICKVQSKQSKEIFNAYLYIDSRTKQPKWRMHMNTGKQIEVEVRAMDAFNVVYVRHRGMYRPDDKILFQSLFKRLLEWAAPKGLFNPPSTKALTVYSSGHPDTTEPEHLSVDVCMSVSGDVKASGEVGIREIPAGNYAVVELKDATIEECGDAWRQLFEGWLPESGYQPGKGAYYIHHLNDPEQHPEKLHSVEMYLPVMPLG